MTAPLDRLLSRLDGVRRTGEGRYIGKCPAHEDKRPSLSVRELADGRLLIHCFSGCGAADVVAAAGLDLRDLYPPADREPWPMRLRVPRIPASDALDLLDLEALTVEIIAGRFAAGEPVVQHCTDLELAARRISTIRSQWMDQPR